MTVFKKIISIITTTTVWTIMIMAAMLTSTIVHTAFIYIYRMFCGIVQYNGSCKCLPVQWWLSLSNKNPSIHWQWYDPMSFTQVWLHPPLSISHSLISIISNYTIIVLTYMPKYQCNQIHSLPSNNRHCIHRSSHRSHCNNCVHIDQCRACIH